MSAGLTFLTVLNAVLYGTVQCNSVRISVTFLILVYVNLIIFLFSWLVKALSDEVTMSIGQAFEVMAVKV